jgi:predicted MPP superfamily phosphohydrolase
MYRFLDPPELRKDKRLIWAATRSALESVGFSYKRSGKKSRSHWDFFLRLLKIFGFLLKVTGFYRKGYGNAKTIRVKEIALEYPNLPPAFDGFRILHLSDLHIDSIPGFASLIINKIKGLQFDICLKEGVPLISHQFEGKQFNHGRWTLGNMTGYTSRGAGVSGMPVRFNCPAEVTVITLHHLTAHPKDIVKS